MQNITYRIPFKILDNDDTCLIADKNHVYIVSASMMWIYDLDQSEWMTRGVRNIHDFTPSVCVMDLEETFIYLFGNNKHIIYKYDISMSIISMINETNLCRNGVGKGITASNGNAYLHGCYIGSWRTLIFNMKTEKFIAVTESISAQVTGMHGYAGTTSVNSIPYYKSGQLAVLYHNMLVMAHVTDTRYPLHNIWNYTTGTLLRKRNSLQLSVLFTNVLLYNFKETEKNGIQIWPSDGIEIKYSIDMTAIVSTPFHVWLYCNNTTNIINQTLEIVGVYDDCINSTSNVAFDGYLFRYVCTQNFSFNFTLMDNNISELTLNMLPIDVDLSLSDEDEYITAWFDSTTVTTPLIVPNYLTIKLMRCHILFDKINEFSYSDDPYINITYWLQPHCYSRIGANFSFNVSVISTYIYIEKHVIITVDTNNSYICNICGLDKNCSFCNTANITIKHDIINDNQALSVSFASNMIDLNVYPLDGLRISYSKIGKEFISNPLELWAIMLIITGLLIIVIIIIYYLRKNRRLKLELAKKEKHLHYVTNPLVISIGIANYYNLEDVMNPGADIFCNDLNGIDRDYENIKRLCKLLNYNLYPKEIKVEWTENEIIQFIKEKTKLASFKIDTLNENVKNAKRIVNGYDAIICIFSGHGYKNCIITSDYQLINKTAIHRLISTNHPQLRHIPRIMIFDVCDGDETRSIHNADYDNSSTDDESDEKLTGPVRVPVDKGKNFGVNDIKLDNQVSSIWHSDQQNPDYKLSLISAANEGFMAKINSIDGSYLIYEFVKRMIANIEQNNLFFGDIIDMIQEDLHNDGKQQITATFNNNTRYLKFVKRNDISIDMKRNSIDYVENDGNKKIKNNMHETNSIQLELVRLWH
eukprot:94230_1